MQAADQNRLPALIFLSALSRVPEGFAHFFTTPLEQINRKNDNHDIKRAEQLFVKSDRLFCFLRENPKRLISSGRQSYLRKPNPDCRNSQHGSYAAVHPLLPTSDCHSEPVTVQEWTVSMTDSSGKLRLRYPR